MQYPIVDDPGRETWSQYGMQFYPSWAFIGADGSVVHRQVGKAVIPDVVQYIESALAGQ